MIWIHIYSISNISNIIIKINFVTIICHYPRAMDALVGDMAIYTQYCMIRDDKIEFAKAFML